MKYLEQNLLKLNNGQLARFSHEDYWGRKIYTFKDGKNYCLLDNVEFYSLSNPNGEPDCPLKEEFQPKDINIFYKGQDEQLSLSEWNDYFEPIEEDESDKHFPFYKDAYGFAEKKFSNKPYQHIWSIVDGDNGKLILLNGYHKCNVLDYLVCKIPWGNGKDSDKDVYLEVKYEE